MSAAFFVFIFILRLSHFISKSPEVNNPRQMAVKLSSLISKLMHSHFSPFIKIRTFFRLSATVDICHCRAMKCLERAAGTPCDNLIFPALHTDYFTCLENPCIFINNLTAHSFGNFRNSLSSCKFFLWTSFCFSFRDTIQSPKNSCEIKFSSVYRTVLIYG